MSSYSERQQPLDLGSRDHFALLHGHHDQFIALSSDGGQGWRECVYEHDQAAYMVDLLQGDPTPERDAYISQAGFGEPRRISAGASTISVLMADLDYYNIPELADLTPHQVWARVNSACPWLPRPTLLADSGRGCYLIWSLASRRGTGARVRHSPAPLGKHDFGRWVTAMKRLTIALKPFGADEAVVDLARVLRIPGSTNTKVGKPVQYWTIGNPVPFALIDKQLRANVDKTQPRPATHPKAKPQPRAGRQERVGQPLPSNVTRLYQFTPSWHQTNFKRIDDIHRLAKHRAPVADGRDRMLFCLAVCLSYVCTSRKAIEAELIEFAGAYFESHPKYSDDGIRQRMGAVLNAYEDGEAGLVVEHEGQERNARFRMRDTTMLRWMEISKSEAEAVELVTLVEPQVKRERKRAADRARDEQKRRERGERPRQEYLADCGEQTAAQIEQVQRLRQQGKTQSEIAKKLGLTDRWVRQLQQV